MHNVLAERQNSMKHVPLGTGLANGFKAAKGPTGGETCIGHGSANDHLTNGHVLAEPGNDSQRVSQRPMDINTFVTYWLGLTSPMNMLWPNPGMPASARATIRHASANEYKHVCYVLAELGEGVSSASQAPIKGFAKGVVPVKYDSANDRLTDEHALAELGNAGQRANHQSEQRIRHISASEYEHTVYILVKPGEGVCSLGSQAPAKS